MGDGDGEGKGAWALRGRKVPEASVGPRPSSDRVLETLDLKGGVTAQRRAPVTEGFPAGSGLLIPWGGPGNAPAPWASVNPSEAHLGWVFKQN